MLIVCDIGNTNTVFGAYDGNTLVAHWRVSTERKRTAEEWSLLARHLIEMDGLALADFNSAMLASVVPPATRLLSKALHRIAGTEPLIVGPGLKTGMPILYENPKEVGADRIVNAVAAYARCQQAYIIVDLGTATTIDCVSIKGEYLGGAIAPGIAISMDALFHAAAKLPRVEFTRPQEVIGRNTVDSIQSGLFYGYAALVDGLVERMREDMPDPPRVIATGGLASVLAPASKTIEEVDEFLTLEGLRILHQRNATS